MPPKRKRPPPTSPTASPLAADTTTHSATALAADTTTTTHSTLLSSHESTTTPRLLNTTFTTHRLSPLHLGTPPHALTLTQASIHALSQRLRDLLVGDVVRGIELGLTTSSSNPDDSAMRTAGALEVVSMGWVRLQDLLGRYVGSSGAGDDDDDHPDTSLESAESTTAPALASPGRRRALQISLRYENGEYAALLLPAIHPHPPQSPAHSLVEGEEFAHLPLLLLRMPAPLKAVICGFVSRTFDCRVSALALGTRSLVGALEGWLGDCGGGVGIGMGAKDVLVTLGFYRPGVLRGEKKKSKGGDVNAGEEQDEGGDTRSSETSVGVKAIDITIPVAELRRFVKAGKAHAAAARRTSNKPSSSDDDNTDPYSPHKRRRLGGDKDEESWTWRSASSSSSHPSDTDQQQPFTEALAAYLRQHLALDMFHPAVRVSRIACGGFVLSEGRVKLFGVPPPPGGEGDGDGDGGAVRRAVAEGMQRGLWGVFGGLVERARVRPLGGDGVV